jgi:PAS domain S-box-containing protein
MRDVIFTVDLNGIIVKYFVPHLQSNLISVPEDYIGNDFRSMLPDHIAVQLEDAIKKIERGEESSEFEYFTGTENYKKWFYAKVSKIINNENIGQGYLVLARDITNRKEEEEKRIILEGKLMRSEQSASLGRIAAGMAHEINNPASTVMSDLQIVKKMLNKLTSYRS